MCTTRTTLYAVWAAWTPVPAAALLRRRTNRSTRGTPLDTMVLTAASTVMRPMLTSLQPVRKSPTCQGFAEKEHANSWGTATRCMLHDARWSEGHTISEVHTHTRCYLTLLLRYPFLLKCAGGRNRRKNNSTTGTSGNCTPPGLVPRVPPVPRRSRG